MPLAGAARGAVSSWPVVYEMTPTGMAMKPRLAAAFALVAAVATLVTAVSSSTAVHGAEDGSTNSTLEIIAHAMFNGSVGVADTASAAVAETSDAIGEAVGGKAERKMAYGMNGFYASDVEKRSGADLQYGQVWAGRWIDKPGALPGFRDRVATVHEAGHTPVVEWWYFGDQISVKAVTQGLPDGRSVARWHELGPKVAKAACEGAKGDLVFVVETEFNKGGVDKLESFDGELAKHVQLVKKACPSATVAIGFGEWRSENWARFDRAAAASDAVGFQLMRSLAKDTRSDYESAPERAVFTAQKLQELFEKPILLHDVALSSYGKDGRGLQADTLERLLDEREALADAGVEMILYRSVRDTPSMAKNNYYGDGEAHWGLWTTTGGEKPAYRVWVGALVDVQL